MARHGYSYVTDRGFASFSRVLDEGPWKDISIKKFDSEVDPPVAKPGLLEAPAAVMWKLRVTWGIRGLVRAMGGATAEELDALDGEWDSAQRALHLALGAEAEHQLPERRAGAERLRGALLIGGGTAQTQLSYDKEVDFGHAQLELASKPPLSADVKAARLEPHLERIEEATNALATGLGRDSGGSRARSRKQRLREALSSCSSAFNAVHGEIEFLIEHCAPGKGRELLQQLHAPFLALLERYPPRARTSAEEVEADGKVSGGGEAVASAEAPGSGG